MWRIDGAVTEVTKYIRRVHEMPILEGDSMTALCGLRVLVSVKGPRLFAVSRVGVVSVRFLQDRGSGGRRIILHLDC